MFVCCQHPSKFALPHHFQVVSLADQSRPDALRPFPPRSHGVSHVSRFGYCLNRKTFETPMIITAVKSIYGVIRHAQTVDGDLQ